METELILKFLKFSTVGFIGTIIDFGVTYLFKEKVKINRFIANSLGFITAVINNYILNKLWTFSDTNPDIVTQFGIFFLISLGGLGINNLLIFFLEKKMNFYVAKFLAICIVVLWNFFMNYHFSFN